MPKPRTPKPVEGLALTAAPSNALKIWHNSARLFVEVPTSTGPHVLTYDLTTSGLSSALALIQGRRFDFPGTPVLSPPDPANLSPPSQRDALAEQIVRKMGLVRG